jgi:hypothetical protein
MTISKYKYVCINIFKKINNDFLFLLLIIIIIIIKNGLR